MGRKRICSGAAKAYEKSPLSIFMSMYGGFEQVGSIGQSLLRKDWQTTIQAGDIVLFLAIKSWCFMAPISGPILSNASLLVKMEFSLLLIAERLGHEHV